MYRADGHSFAPINRNPQAGTGIADFAHLSAKGCDDPDDLFKRLAVAGFQRGAVGVKPGGDCLCLKLVSPTTSRGDRPAIDMKIS
jgi:hypothetical protein